MIRRHQLFEFCDMPWIPAVIREGFMDCLNNIHRLLEPYQNIAPILSTWAERLDATDILDIGAGGGEQVATILKYLQTQGLATPRFVLSDLYPDPAAYRELVSRFGPEFIGYVETPVAIASLPPDKKVLTIFSAFHHLPPPAASALLNEIVTNRNGICIVEFTRRTWLDLLSMFPAFFMNLLALLTTSRFRLSKLLLSPVIATMVSFDGFVSALRSYTAKELMAMLPPGTEQTFLVEYGEVRWGRLPFSKSTYFLLSRKNRLGSD